MLSRILFFVIFGVLASMPVSAEDKRLKPGDFGYGHDDLHSNGSIDAIRKKTGTNCCGGRGECRETHIRVSERLALLNGEWCKIPMNVVIQFDIPLNGLSMVCANETINPKTKCPEIYCAAAKTDG
jgi:hypothetical protein